MPQYIDLLRAHLQKGNKEREDQANEEDHNALLEEEGVDEQHEASGYKSDTDLLVEEAEGEHEGGSASAQGGTAKPIAKDDDKKWLNQCVHYVATAFKAASQHQVADLPALSDHIKSLLVSINQQPDRLAVLELMLSETGPKIQKHHGGLVEKSIMLMLYAIKVGLQLRLEEEELHALVMAGMLHHIGMTQIPASIRDKKAKLSKEELKQIGMAPQLGTEYLQQCGISDKRILTASLQARERFDGSGPTGLKENEISSTARIIGLLSMFEALIHYRAYRKRMLPRDAIREILLHHKKAYDPAFLKSLIDAISLYPVGTFVQLNSGDIGQVVRVHRRLVLRPVVHLTLDRHGNNIKPRDINLQSQPSLLVERCMYPEEIKAL